MQQITETGVLLVAESLGLWIQQDLIYPATSPLFPTLIWIESSHRFNERDSL